MKLPDGPVWTNLLRTQAAKGKKKASVWRMLFAEKLVRQVSVSLVTFALPKTEEQRICEENRAHSSPLLCPVRALLAKKGHAEKWARGNCVVCRIDKARMQSCVNDQRDWGVLVLQIAKN